MRNSNTILASVQAFMDKMQDGDMCELVANLQAALEFKGISINCRRFPESSLKEVLARDILL